MNSATSYPKNHPRNPDRRPGPAPSADRPDPPPPAAPVNPELAEYAERQRQQAAQLRGQASKARAEARAHVGMSAHAGRDMEPWRRDRLASAEAAASDFDARAARCELRAARADEGKLLHGPPENQDPNYLRSEGYSLLRLGCQIVTS